MVYDKQAALAMIARMPDDEPVFVLRAQDAAAVHAIEAWVEEASALGASEEKTVGGEEHRDAFLVWQETHATKVPD